MDKTENQMTDEEIEEFDRKTEVKEDVWDKLELLKRLLDNSHLEKMYHLKRSTKLGPLCPYYIKASKLFDQSQKADILSLLKSINSSLLE